jgi:hypothetical protein
VEIEKLKNGKIAKSGLRHFAISAFRHVAISSG